MCSGWSNVFDLVNTADADPGYDLTKILQAKKRSTRRDVRYGRRSHVARVAAASADFLGALALRQAAGPRVVCHASAWDIDFEADVRIKMCIDQTAEDFTTIHHELGHNFYQRAYNAKPGLFRDSANDGFHEAVGDTIALSITPEYLVKIGLLDKAPDASKDIGLLLSRALEKLAFLPFGVVVDQWRWKVFSGDVTPANYNQAWWDLRTRYQGVASAVPRSENDFDPGAKYHVPGNVPYTRYFLAAILQFQFHRALSQTAGCTGPLHRCSIYGTKEAGKKLDTMLQLVVAAVAGRDRVISGNGNGRDRDA